MSQLTNNAYVARSMNGIISIDDGAGSTMEGGVITANELVIDEIQSKSPPNVVSLYTETTTVINVGSPTSTLNVSNLNVSNINVPLITFTTLNASTVNSQTSNTSTSNASTSNSSTSNSSTANNGTTNSSTSNSSTSNSGTANNGTTNSSTVNVSTLNFGTTSGTTINMSTVNASIVNTNEIQGISSGDNITLYTNTTGNINLGDTTTNLTHLKGLNVLLESVGDTYVQTANDLYLSTLGNTTMNGSSLFIGSNISYTIGNINIGNVSTNSLTINSKNSFLSSVNNTTVASGGIIYLNSNGNTEICNSGFGGKMVLSGNQEIRAKDRSMPSYLFTDAFAGGDVYMGNVSTNIYLNCPLSSSKSIKCIDLNASTLNVSTIANISTLNASIINVSTLNASTTTFGTINNTTINTSTLNASTANISFLKTTNISSISSSSTNNLYPDSTTGILNICPNYTNGAINIGNSTDVGSFSLSQGTININPKTTLNVANQIGTGTVNICDANTFNGTLDLASTIPTSGTNTVNIGSTSTALTEKSSTHNISSTTLNVSATTINLGTTAMSSLNINKPLTPNYDSLYNATNGAGANTDIGYVYFVNNTSVFNMANNALVAITNLQIFDVGVYLVNVRYQTGNQTASTLTATRQWIRVGYGAINNTGTNVNEQLFVSSIYQAQGVAGDSMITNFSVIYVVTSATAPNNYLTLNAQSNFTPTANNFRHLNSRISATRIG